MPSRGTCPGTRGSTTAATGTSSSCRASASSPASSSVPGSTSMRSHRSARPRPCGLADRPTVLSKASSGLDRCAEIQALVLSLLDQHHGLERVHVVDALLLALGRDLRLVRPVVELHLRDPRDLADLAEVELDLVEVLRDVDRLEELGRLVVHHKGSFRLCLTFKSYSDLLRVWEAAPKATASCRFLRRYRTRGPARAPPTPPRARCSRPARRPAAASRSRPGSPGRAA